MTSPRDTDKEGRKESFIRRPVPKYQHYIDHFEELYRQSPLAKVVVRDALLTPPATSKPKEDAVSSNTSSTFKVPAVSSLPKPKPVSASIPAFIMSPVAQLIHEMQTSRATTPKDREKEGASTSLAKTSPQERIQGGGRRHGYKDVGLDGQRPVSGRSPTCFQFGKESECSKDDVVVEDAPEEDASQVNDIQSLEDVVGEMNEETEKVQTGEDLQMKGLDPPFSIKPRNEECLTGAVPKPKERRRSVIRTSKTVNSNNDTETSHIVEQQSVSDVEANNSIVVMSVSDVEHNNSGSSDDLAKPSQTLTDLDQWIVKWLGSGLKHVAVEGHRLEDPEGSYWHSTAIFKRISSSLVETSSGSRYRLHGNINKLLAVDHGFSEKFLRRFRHGFPARWKTYLVEEAIEQSSKKLPEAVTELQDTSKTSNTIGNNRKKHTKQKTHTRTTKKENIPAEKKTPVILQKQKQQAPIKVSDTTPVSRKKEVAVVTPTFVSVKEIRTTKSGRKVLPPLQFWRGQRQRTLLYMDGAAEILEGSVDHTPLSATSRSLKGSIDISQRAKRYHTREETPQGRRRRVKSKNTNSDRDSSVQESEGEVKVPERKEAREDQTVRRVDPSTTLKEDSKECILEALSDDPVQGSLRKSTRSSLNNSANHHSQNQSGSMNEADVYAASEPSSTVSGSEGTTAMSKNPYDLHSAVMGVVKEHHRRRKSNQSRRRSQRSLSAPGKERVEDSFNISDDEDFKNESFTSASEERKDNNLSGKGHPGSGTGSRTASKHKRKRSSKANEKALLGSNMLPSVVLEKVNDNAGLNNYGVDNDSNTMIKNKESPGAEKQDEPEQNEVKKTKDTQRSRRSKRKNKKSPERVETDQEQEKNEKWEPDELDRLHRALKMIPPSSRQFWHRVASSVGTRTEWECQQAHQAKLEGTTKTSNQSKATSNKDSTNKDSNQVSKEPVALTAAKGTMRRKRQLRELIQQHNQASEEDLFDSTPFKKQRKTTLPLLNLDLQEEEEDSEEMMAKTPGSARLKTPSTRFHNILAPLSGKKTPHSTTFSPGLLYSVERKHMDKYIFGMQKKRVGRRLKKIPETALEVRSKRSRTRTIAVTPSVSEAFQIDPVQDQEPDSETEADYYWSDEENIAAPSTR